MQVASGGVWVIKITAQPGKGWAKPTVFCNGSANDIFRVLKVKANSPQDPLNGSCLKYQVFTQNILQVSSNNGSTWILAAMCNTSGANGVRGALAVRPTLNRPQAICRHSSSYCTVSRWMSDILRVDFRSCSVATTTRRLRQPRTARHVQTLKYRQAVLHMPRVAPGRTTVAVLRRHRRHPPHRLPHGGTRSRLAKPSSTARTSSVVRPQAICRPSLSHQYRCLTYCVRTFKSWTYRTSSSSTRQVTHCTSSHQCRSSSGKKDLGSHRRLSRQT